MTAPSAWRATLPVSRTSLRPPQSISSRCILNIDIFLLSRGRFAEEKSAAQTQTLDQVFVARLILGLHVIEQAAALRDHLDQPAPRVIVLRVGLEVLGQIGDALREHGHLHLRRAR